MKLSHRQAQEGRYHELHHALVSARSQAWWRVFRRGAVRSLGLTGAALALGTLATMLWPASWVGPVGGGVLAIVLIASGLGLLLMPLLRVPSLPRYTRRIDERYASGERNEFLSAFELGGTGARAGTSPALIEALVAERVEAARRLDLGAPGQAPLGRRWAALPAAAVVLLALLVVVAPGRFTGAVRELLHPRLPLAQPVTIEVLTGNLRVEQGADVLVRARVTGGGAEPTLRARRGAGVWRNVAAERETQLEGEASPEALAGSAEPGSIYRFTIPKIESETHYRVAAGGAVSPEYLIRVIEPLRIVSFQLKYQYPDYSRLEAETIQAVDGAVAALRGTEVTVTFETNQPVRGGVAELASGTKAKVSMDGPSLGRVTFPIVHETTYTLALERDRRGGDPEVGGARLGPYSVTPAPDREPMVAVLRPGEDTDLPADLRLPLVVHAADDYGLSSLHLNYSYEGSGPQRQRLVRFTGYPREATETYVWNLSDLKLLPGDVVSYYLEVYDNDTVSGPKSARSRVFTVRFPTLTDLYAEVEEEHKEAKADLEDVHEEGVELKQELERIAREMTKFPVSQWEDKQEIAQAFERQEQIRQQLEALAQNLGESLQRLENQNVVDEEVLQKVLEIQKLMDQISDPDLREAFKRLGEQLSQLDQNEIQKALQDLTLTHEELLRNLEKTIEMLRQVELEEKFERAVKQAEELLARQDKINEDLDRVDKDKQDGQDKNSKESKESKDGGKNDRKESGKEDDSKNGENSAGNQQDSEDELSRLTQEEKEGIENAEELAKLLEELARQLEEMNQEVSKELERLADESDQESSMQSSMQSAKQQMTAGSPKGARKSGQKASQSMESLLEQLRMQQQQMMNEEMAELGEKLRAAAHQLLKVSEDEETLVASSDRSDAQRMAEDQDRLLGATRRVNALIEEIARTSMMVGTDFAGILGQPMRLMENATSSYERGNVSGGRMHSFQALAQVNEAILDLMNTEQNCNAGGSCNSMKAAMQKMMGLSQSQQQVNEGTRQLMQQGGQRLGESSSQRLARLAAQQAAIQKGLEEVAQDLAGRREVLGRLGDLAGDMEDVTKDMQRAEIDERLLSKQHEILNRLLDAQRSVRKRDLGRERLSRTGDQELGQRQLPAVPEELLSRRERLEADILRGRSDPYPPSFRELVESYFRALTKAPANDEPAPD